MVEMLGGSSPLAREIRSWRAGVAFVTRFIPARAGNTRSAMRAMAPRPVHPRSRGKYPGQGGGEYAQDGSSPLAREIPSVLQWQQPTRRFIPARAGNTGKETWATSSGSVHPRSRGKYPFFRKSLSRPIGSSPLAREIRNRRGRGDVPRPVHPRSRGKYTVLHTFQMRDGGSSPLAREIPLGSDRVGLVHRFIPARAGNTRFCPAGQYLQSVHPRSRGKYWGWSIHGPNDIGSSPLAREIPSYWITRRHKYRFIPARAGNTMSSSAASSTRCGSSPLAREIPAAGFTPRISSRFIPARAENTPQILLQPGQSGGSSPLAREILAQGRHAPGMRRFIPARAGNTSRFP